MSCAGRASALVVLAFTAVGPLAAAAAAETVERPNPTIRALQPRGARILAQGTCRSASLAALVAELRGSDVVVYLDVNDANEPGRVEGALLFQGATTNVRYLRVWLRPHVPDEPLIAALGHELQHVVEVAKATGIRSATAVKSLYLSIGREGRPNMFETDAAREAGLRVVTELEHARGRQDCSVASASLARGCDRTAGPCEEADTAPQP